jgi:8-oxo-(d)GTP phosphatase
MNIFCKEIELKIVSKSKYLFPVPSIVNFQEFISNSNEFEGNIFIQDSNDSKILTLIEHIEGSDLKLKLKSITLITSDLEYLKEKLKQVFIYVKAAGGIVENASKEILFIKRLGKWDLPKGKAEKNELPQTTAVREVEEECGVIVEVKKKIGSTWHTYTTRKGVNLKRTRWYAMKLISDENMKPQKEEGIEDIQFMDQEKYILALESSYGTINEIFKKYLELER